MPLSTVVLLTVNFRARPPNVCEASKIEALAPDCTSFMPAVSPAQPAPTIPTFIERISYGLDQTLHAIQSL